MLPVKIDLPEAAVIAFLKQALKDNKLVSGILADPNTKVTGTINVQLVVEGVGVSATLTVA